MDVLTRHRWLQGLSDEDLAFLKRFILASGSLKGLADVYDVSYPTIRLRLDRLIQKIQILDDASMPSEFERALRALYADGRIDLATMNVILEAHQRKEEPA
jgi:hypothetical protein